MIIIVTKEKKIKQKEIILEDKMKKVFSVLLSLFMLWGGVLISCSADSESNGGSAPEALKLIICSSQGDAKESTDLTYNKAEGTGGFFYVKSNYDDLSAYKITEISLVRTSDDDATDITSKVNIEEKSRFNGYKIDFSSAVSNAGNYKIIVYAQKGSEKEENITLNLTVEAGSVNPEEKPTPEITKQPESVQWKAGEDAIPLTVEAKISSGKISYQWHKDGNPIDGATSASYTPDKTNGKGSYFVVVSNASDKTKSVKSSQVSVIILAEDELLPPVINTDLADAVSYDKVSDIKALSITATAEGAEIYYLWYKDGTPIGAPSTDASTYTPTGFGSYYCALYALKAGKTSQTINSKTIIISESAITVNVSIRPTSAYTGTELTASVTYNVENANVSYQWEKTDGNSGADIPISGATNKTYTPTEAGRYQCKVTATSAINAKNTVTKKSTPVTVSVKQSDDPVMPVINNINGKNSDFELAVKEGDSFTLTVSASTTDSGALTYEWFKQGNTTSLGTGTSYSKSNVTSSDAGKYYVRVTNTLNGKPASTDSFKVTVTITSSEIGSANGGFSFN